MSQKESSLEERKAKCEHEWEAIGEKYSGTHLELQCKKCGKKKEVALFLGAALATVIGPLMEVPLMISLTKFGLFTKRYFPRSQKMLGINC